MAKKDRTELLPPEGDPEVGRTVFAILKEILDDKDELGLPKQWNRNHELIRNRHWKNDDVEVPLVSINLCHVHVQRTCNMMTDQNPTFDVVQLGEAEDLPEGEDQAFDLLQKSAIHWWNDQEQQDVFDSSVRLGETNGIAIEKVIFNPNLEYPLGEVETINVSPFHFGWYPVKLVATRNLQQCEAVLHYYPLSIREARRRWPDKADLIKPDSDIIKDLQDERRDINSMQGAKKPKNMLVTIAETAKELFNWMNRDQEAPSDEVLIVECWCHDYTTVDGQDAEEKKPGEVVYKKAKYRGNIRCVVACNGDKILEDRSNPSINDQLPDEKAMMTYLWDKYPFSAANSVKDPANAWGATDLEQLEWLNHELNKSVSQFVLEKDKSARSKIKNPLTSGVENEDFTNYYSEINPVNADESAAIQWLVYPGSSMDYQASITMFKDLFLTVAQSFEMDQLTTSSNAIAYKTLAALMERQATMQRGKTRNYSRLIRDRGRMYLSHLMNWGTEPRYINFENSDGIKETKRIVGSEMIIPAKLTVVAGSTLPQSNVQKREEALDLFVKQAIDQPKLLEELNVSGRKDIVKRMQAGPVGAVMNNLSMMGVPPELIQIFQQVAVMEPKEIDKAIKEGQIPPFQLLLQQLARAMAGQPEPQPQENPIDNAEVQVKIAQAEKTKAETAKIVVERDLVLEQINTEKVDQRVKMAGVKFDTDKMQIEKARTVHNITRERRPQQEKEAPGKPKAKEPEEGRRPQVSVTPGPINEPQRPEAAPLTSEAEAIPTGYNESGMESNNRPQPEL